MPVNLSLLLFAVQFILGCNSFRLVSFPVKPSFGRTLTRAKLAESNEFSSSRNRLAADLLEAAREVGQVGKLARPEDRQRLEELAQKLRPFSDPRPARSPLRGTHSLVYSGSDSGPTAGLLGPFVGKVTQVFWNETVYQNRVRFGPLQVSIFGRRTLVDDETINVKFYEIQVHLWDQQVLARGVDFGPPPGVWDFIFVGKICYGGEELLLRVMNTPQLFILTQAAAD